MPLRAYVQPQPEPGHAVLRVMDLDALPEGLTLSIQRQQGPDTHLADDGWRRTEAWLQPEHVALVKGDLEFHLGPEICDRLAGVATIRLRVKEPDIGVVGTTVVAWPPMLTSGAVDPSRRGQDDTIRLRSRQPEPPAPLPRRRSSRRRSSSPRRRRQCRTCARRAIRCPRSRRAAAAPAG